MEKYSHGPFEVSGYRISVDDPIGAHDLIMDTWKTWFSENIGDRVIEKAYPSLYAVYYNYRDPLDPEKKGYDMLIGYITQDGAVQTDSMITTVQIPAQNYEYMTITDISPDNIFGTWDALNKMPYSALTRNYGYDLDMYNEAHTEMTIALSVDPDF